MPCRDYEDSGPRTVENPKTVAMLCAALTALDALGSPLPVSCRQWWAAHQREDKARRAAERATADREARRKAVLAKLSKDDKEILGL